MTDLPQDAQVLADKLAEARGISSGEAILAALKETLQRATARRPVSARSESDFLRELGEISGRYKSLPLLDHRHADEIIGYDEAGMPT